MSGQPVPAELLWAMREIVKRAVMTLAALRDPDRRYLGWSRLPVAVVHDVAHAYGYSAASVRNFAPTPHEVAQMEVVLPWLAWLRREEGEAACRRFLAWSMGTPLWRIGQRERCSERTILNRMDRSICAIIHRFVGRDVQVETVEEPYLSTPYAMVFERPAGPHGGEVVIKRVYVGGQGFMRGGRKLRTGQERYDLRHD